LGVGGGGVPLFIYTDSGLTACVTEVAISLSFFMTKS